MANLGRSIKAAPSLKEIVHKRMPVAGQRNPALTSIQFARQQAMLPFTHLKSIGLGVTAGFMQIWRITIKQGLLVIIESDNFHSRTVLDLDGDESLGNYLQPLNSA